VLGRAQARAEASFADQGIHGESVPPSAPPWRNAPKQYANSAQTAAPNLDAGKTIASWERIRVEVSSVAYIVSVSPYRASLRRCSF